MPYSENDGKDMIKQVINDLIVSKNTRVIDLGCGYGIYGRMIEKPCLKIGVDAMDYRQRFKLNEVYDSFYVHDIRDLSWLKNFGHFDIAIAGDVLEHMKVEEAQGVLHCLESIADTVVCSMPYNYVQHNIKNHWEEHIQDDLTPELIRERYPELRLIKYYASQKAPWNGKPYLGYYIWQREKTI